MRIEAIAGFAVITKKPDASRSVYLDAMQLPLKAKNDYLSMDRFDGAKHFGIWPLAEAAKACFGSDNWPEELPEPQATIEFELESVEAVEAAVEEMQSKGQAFVHGARVEPWGQTIARFLSPEGLLVGLSFAPWHHELA